MAEVHVIGALRNKRAEPAGTLRQLEQHLAQQRANLAHLDAAMRLFDPDIRLRDILPKQPRVYNIWFRPGECLRLIYDKLREATQLVTTRELAEQMITPERLITYIKHVSSTSKALIGASTCLAMAARRMSADRGQGAPRVCRQDEADPKDQQRRADLDPADPTAAQPGEDDLSNPCRNHADDDEDGRKPQAENDHGQKPEDEIPPGDRRQQDGKGRRVRQ